MRKVEFRGLERATRVNGDPASLPEEFVDAGVIRAPPQRSVHFESESNP